ncbi:tetratricopeptide repeat protein [Flavisolibacter ginsengisoli]|jgi:tetratricopeptide (TPR) repeat protein|uniref:Tetratricopeptide repeat-containing protein n=1 Tax=Flavisolibacter ginsengisoli DSM 18119 TaxID=1121884 RepID=A0A1M5BTR3_9BACT|nr:tetratricopeptide repeat protein [Flavisolibacter ginsengisoli]SHF45806.1 hypothetical protein SAMN02745131_02672 [Flavisolibacter ginsengisoli DSM 18119]
MDESLHNNQTIINYLDGLMNPEEQAAFEKQMTQDPALKEQVESLRVAVEAVRQSATRERVSTIHQEMMKELKTQQSPAKVTGISRVLRYTIGAAAAVLILFIGIQTFRYLSNTPGKLYNETFVDYSLSSVRGAGDNASLVENDYRTQAYNDVIKDASKAGLSQKDSFLVAISYLKTGNLPTAITWLEQVNASSPFAKDAQFYLSLAYLKNKNYSEALGMMRIIRNDANHPYHENISGELVEKVRKLQ